MTKWEAMTLADKMVVLNAGRVQQVGHPWNSTTIPTTCFRRRLVHAADEFHKGASD